MKSEKTDLENITLKEILDDIDTYIVCSTLNQIVNYIPLKLIESYRDKSKEKVEMFNLTIDKTSDKSNSEDESDFKRFDNKKWDENLYKVYDNKKSNDKKNNVSKKAFSDLFTYNKETNSIPITRNELNIENSLNKIFNREDDDSSALNGHKSSSQKKVRKILWNVTGGQRTTFIAIQQYIKNKNRYDDYIMYLEGNSNKIVIGKLNKKNSLEYKVLDENYEIKVLDENYEIKALDLNTVFKLAGFEIKNYKKENNYLSEDFVGTKEYELCKKFYKYYIVNENHEFRKLFISLNKGEEKNEDKVEAFWKALKKIPQNEYFNADDFSDDDSKILLKINGNSTKKFGYILEYMTLYSIKENLNKSKLKNYFLEMQHSINLDKFNNSLKDTNTSKLCEFDIVLLSKSGQVVIFECKSGTMSSDVGKARQYTAYAASGVYGKPILITPLIKQERIKIHNSLENGSIDKDTKDAYDSAVIEAIRAAARANLDIWGIDEIDEKLESLYNELDLED